MTVFFDLDDTLYDRGLPFIEAVREFFGDTVADPRLAYRVCSVRSNEVFLPSQRGEITMDEMVIYRWCRGFADLGITISAEEALSFQKLYRSRQDCITLSPVLETMLRDCAARADGIGVLTNGPSEKQWNKLQRLGLLRLIPRERILVSGDIGIDKPDPAIFRLAEKCSGAGPAQLLYVGDSLSNDIIPASLCGWYTLWFNREAKPVPPELRIDAAARSEE